VARSAGLARPASNLAAATFAEELEMDRQEEVVRLLGRRLDTAPAQVCPDCRPSAELNRRDFLRTSGAAAAAVGLAPLGALAAETPSKSKAASTPESLVKVLYDSFSDTQKSAVCFDWDYVETKAPPRGRARGLLRTYVANNWNITPQVLKGGDTDFYTKDQQQVVREIFEGLIRPEWQAKVDQQLEDDAGGFGHEQSLAIFGKPGDGKFEFVMTGRHMTLRCDGNSTPHVAFGGPIFYGHAGGGEFNEKPDHPDNVYWPQAQAANKLYEMLGGKQQKQALVANMPREQDSGFRSPAEIAGLPVTEMSSDQKEHLQGVLKLLLEPYRTDDQNEALACLNKNGGLDKCSLAFYSAGDLGNDKVWDNWRLEGPAFVWHFRGTPHVHVWVNVADDASVKLNA
jgi:hypothetical protein